MLSTTTAAKRQTSVAAALIANFTMSFGAMLRAYA
jgi:hypothetical protein